MKTQQKQTLGGVLKNAGIDGFLVALIGCVALAYFWYEPGIYEGTFSLTKLGDIGISAIFFFYGLRLSLTKLKEGLSNWRLHTVVQLTTFVVFPLVALAIVLLFAEGALSELWLGFFFLAALPSTVSSSVVMVSIARGNLPAAIFNASISSMVGVFITPLWVSILLVTGDTQLDLLPIILKLILQVLVPVTVGVLLNRKLGWIAEKYKNTLKIFDQTIILLIIYTSFSESFAQEMFSGFSVWHIVLLGIGMVGFFFLIYGITNAVCHLLKFNREDRITTVFCGSKKSLVHGTVMSKVLFTGLPSVGIILLPLMLYHSLQLIVVSIIARGMARKADTVAAGKS